MRTNHVAAAIVASLLCALSAASCVQRPPGMCEETDEASRSVTNVSNVDERVAEAPEALTAINCKLRGLDVVECMIQCAQAGFPCTPKLRHPRKVDAGYGDLIGCGEALSRKTCVYEYTNGDRCYVADGLPWIPCSYPGG
jgi:hypothetical protein